MDASPLVIRPADMSDALDILEWRNDPLTRAMSRNPSELVKDAHIQWFNQALNDQNRVFMIAALDGVKAGMVRFDHIEPGVWEMSIAIKPDMRNKKIGAPFLKLAISAFQNMQKFEKLTAEIKTINIASFKIFENCGFQKTAEDAEYFYLEFYGR